MRARRRRNFIGSLAHFLFGWLRRSIPEVYLEGLVCTKHDQFDCNICRQEWEQYEIRNPNKAQALRARTNRPGTS